MSRPELKGDWKQFSLLIIVIITIVAGFFIWKIFSQIMDERTGRKMPAKGILVLKKNLHRGQFLIILQDDQVKKEFDLAGYDYFFDKVMLGDSLSKHSNTFLFDVYRRSNSTYKFVATIGYE